MSPAGLAVTASNQTWRPVKHLRFLDRKLLDIAAGRLKRLAIFMPPRHGKSTLTSQYFPAWYIGTFPERRIIFTSYEADFAANWGRKARECIDQYGRQFFRVELDQASHAANHWDLAGHQGGMITAGIGGPITGRGADVLLIDDPVKNEEEARSPAQREKVWDWFCSTAYTRLEPNGAIILIMTRWHADDLAGRLLAKAKEEGEYWEVISFPGIAHENDVLGRQPGEALWADRYPVAKLKEIQRAIGAYWWGCLYDQNPGAEGGSEWPDSYFGPGIWFDDWPRDLTIKVGGLDPSKGKDAKFGDYSAFIDLGRDKEGVLYCDAELVREPSPKLVARAIERHRLFQADAWAVETNQFQELLAEDIIRQSREAGFMLPIHACVNTVNKEVRIRRLGPDLAKGNIRFKGGSPGAKLLVQQLRDFPNGEHDDGPDALEMTRRLMIEMWNGRFASPVAGRLRV